MFQNGVKVVHPDMNLRCQTLTLDAPTADTAQSLTAQDDVQFTLAAQKGQKINGTAQKAVYTYKVNAGKTNDLVELTGQPKLTMDDGSTFENSVIIVDRTSGKLIAPGKYLVRYFGSSAITNELPSIKLDMGKKRRKKA